MKATVWTLFVVLVTACAGNTSESLLASNVLVTDAMPGTQMRAAYLTLTNNTDAMVVIDRVSSPQYASVEMHESVLEDGIARMRSIQSISIAPGQSDAFKQGGKHLMLMQALDAAAPVTLHFYSNNLLLLSITAGAKPDPD